MSRIVPKTIDTIIRLDKELAEIKESCDEVTRTKEGCDKELAVKKEQCHELAKIKERCDKELVGIKEQCDELVRTKEICEEEHKKTKEKRDALIKQLPDTFMNYEPQKPFNLSVMMESLPSDYNLTSSKIKQDERTRYDKEMEIYHKELRIKELFKKFKRTGNVDGGKRRKTRRR
jgi:hypothetical protein